MGLAQQDPLMVKRNLSTVPAGGGDRGGHELLQIPFPPSSFGENQGPDLSHEEL